MKMFIRKLLNKNILTRVQNKLFIRIGLFQYSNIKTELNIRKISDTYIKKIVEMSDVKLLKDYSAKYRSHSHYEKYILPRLIQHERYKGFAIIDGIKNEIAYLSWVDFENINIPEVEYNQSLVKNEAYFFDDHCVDFHQRRGLHATIFNERLSYCYKTGVSKVYIVVYLNNNKALQNLKKYNFKLKKIFNFYPLLKNINYGRS